MVSTPASPECAEALTRLLGVFDRLGLPVAMDILEGPWSRLTFLGFELDSSALEIRLPQAKLRELQQLIRSWVGRTSCSRKELELLVGQLGHASRVVAPGKTFMWQFFELLAGVRQAHHHIRLNAAFRLDLLWWATVLDTWNGMAMMQTSSVQMTYHVWTDASGHFGCGAVYPTSLSWLQLPWPQPPLQGAVHLPWPQLPLQGVVHLQEESILLQELLPIVLAGATWGRTPILVSGMLSGIRA